MTAQALSLWLFGALFGLRHALEPDHLLAVSTLVAGRPRPRVAVALGVSWGLGHTLTLVLVATVLASLRMTLSETVAAAFELAVAIILITLGTMAIRQALAGQALNLARPDVRRNLPPGPQPAPAPSAFSRGDWKIARRALMVGIAHGLAGSGAITALIAAQFPSVAGRIAYVGLFGAGSMVGMATFSGLAGAQLARAGLRPAFGRAIGTAAGGLAITLGAVWSIAAIRMLAR